MGGGNWYVPALFEPIRRPNFQNVVAPQVLNSVRPAPKHEDNSLQEDKIAEDANQVQAAIIEVAGEEDDEIFANREAEIKL